MMPLTRSRVAVALVLVAGLVAIEVGVRAWKGAATPAPTPVPRPGVMKVKGPPASGVWAIPPQPPSEGYLGPTAIDFAGARTLGEALELVRRELILDDKADFAALLSEDRVSEAVRKGTSAYEAVLIKAEKEGKPNYGLKEYFIDKAKPVFMKIAEERTWPPDCNFFGFYGMGRSIDGKRVQYDGFWLRLEIHTEKSKQGHDSFAIPIINMGFGEVGL